MNERKRARARKYGKPGYASTKIRPDQDFFFRAEVNPGGTAGVYRMCGAQDPGQGAAEEHLPDSKITTATGFVSRPPKGFVNQGVSTLTRHTKQVPTGTKSDRRCGEVTVSKGEKSKGASPTKMLANLRKDG